MGRRTEIQLALLVAGIAVWGYGTRADVPWMQFTGIGFFALATLLRFTKRREPKPTLDESEESTSRDEEEKR